MLFRTSHAAAAMVACVAIARAEPPALEPNRQLTPLDAYVAAPDASRDWEIVSKTRRGHATELVVRLTSQTWRTADEVSTPVWRHLLTIVAPDDAIGTTALLYITGGSHSDEPDAASGMLRRVAIGTKTIAASLRNVPGQPQRVMGSDEPDRVRYEDDLLAASWNRFIATEDPTWIAQFAMAKAGVAAMDAVQSVVATVEGAPRVERFTVAGAS
ncbi:MAG: PhoPQ-activated protein PqaA family protein, partial [Planctomycetota bacterium]